MTRLCGSLSRLILDHSQKPRQVGRGGGPVSPDIRMGSSEAAGADRNPRSQVRGDGVQRPARAVDLLHSGTLKVCGVLGEDGAAPAAEHQGGSHSLFLQKSEQVREKLEMTAVVRTDRHRIDPFLERGGRDLFAGHVETEVDDLHRPRAGQQRPVQGQHRGIVTVVGGHGGQYSEWFLDHVPSLPVFNYTRYTENV